MKVPEKNPLETDKNNDINDVSLYRKKKKKAKRIRKNEKTKKRNLIPKPEKLTARERGIVQWITRFESGYRRKRIGTRFFGVWE